MLNNDDAKPSPVPPVLPVIANDPPPRTMKTEEEPFPTPAPENKQSRDQNIKDEASLPRKRQRVEDSPSPKTTVKGMPPPTEKSTAPAVSPQQSAKLLTAQSPSRNNSIVTAVPGDGDLEMELSITNVQPSEELTRYISDFIFVNLNEEGLENLEIEAKLGRIIDVSTNDRIRLPVQTEAGIFPPFVALH